VLAAGLSAALSGARQRASREPIVYTLSFPEPERRWMQVEVAFEDLTRTPLSLRMSRRSPGRYTVHEFARNVYDVRAFGAEERPLDVDHPEPHEWNVIGHDGAVRVRYRVFGDQVDGTYLAVDPTHAHINIPAALMWAVGHEIDGVVIRLEPPPQSRWRVATQLFATDHPYVFTAPNLAYLVDSPIEASVFTSRTFVADLADDAPPTARPRIALALHHTGTDRDADSFVDGLRRLTREQAAIFGEYPAFEQGVYTFIADYLPWANADAMEHRNSTILTHHATIAGDRTRLLATAAHEFFHGWNVERIRPRSLEPFSLLDSNTSGDLWLAEGFSNYFETLTMLRAGLTDLDQACAALGHELSTVLTSPARLHGSAEDMSRMATVMDGGSFRDRMNRADTYVSYYSFGAVLALGFDLSLRERTGSRRSLDDFMRAMWTHHGRLPSSRIGFVDRPYTHRDVRERLAEIAGDRRLADGLVDRYVKGREVMDYRHLLGLAGLRLTPVAPGRTSLGLVEFEQQGNRVVVAAPPPAGSPAGEGGLGQDDTILMLGRRRIERVGDVDDALAAYRPGAEVALQVRGRSEHRPRTVSLKLIEHPALTIAPAESIGGSLTEAERAFRSAWLGRRFVSTP
jgi:predicted metalloprotease with PDZ domain